MNFFPSTDAVEGMKRMLTAILILAACGGCSTIATLTTSSEAGPGRHRWLYSGTRNDLYLMSGKAPDCTGLSGCVGVLDFPWSLALDTAVVPVMLPLQLILGSPPSPESPFPQERTPEAYRHR